MRAIQTLCLVLVLSILSSCTKAPEPPPPPQYLHHTVKYSGETLGAIAKWYTGETNNWHVIVAANPGLKPERVSLGMVILIPQELVKESRPFPAKVLKAPTTDSRVEPTTQPVSGATPQPTPAKVSSQAPTPAPTVKPTFAATTKATAEPTAMPSVEATVEPTSEPTEEPTPVPTPTGKSREDLLQELLDE